ncbi:MAG: hypothetical protein MI747_03120, partial [Desulfobacterales bacterium]|nr:hypothetical protein [Desulfobacterales bacterium]
NHVVKVTTPAFELEQLIWQGICVALDQSSPGTDLVLTLDPNTLWFNVEAQSLELTSLDTPDAQALIHRTGASTAIDTKNNRFGFTWPATK